MKMDSYLSFSSRVLLVFSTLHGDSLWTQVASEGACVPRNQFKLHKQQVSGLQSEQHPTRCLVHNLSGKMLDEI